jgi:hypothetical protein
MYIYMWLEIFERHEMLKNDEICSIDEINDEISTVVWLSFRVTPYLVYVCLLRYLGLLMTWPDF